jgi:hypothetical protein
MQNQERLRICSGCAHCELSYRKGFVHGAYGALEAIWNGASPHSLEQWILLKLFKWRLSAKIKAAQGKHVAQKLPPECDG